MKKFIKRLFNAYQQCWCDFTEIWCIVHIIFGVSALVLGDAYIPNFLIIFTALFILFLTLTPLYLCYKNQDEN